MVGAMPVERSAQLLLLTWTGVDSKNGSTADQGRTGREDSSSRLWRPARALGTHAKQGPSTGHSAVGLRQAGKCLLMPRPHFTAHHARLVTRWSVLRTALLFIRSAVRLVYADLSEPVAVCLPKQALCELGDRVLGGNRFVEHCSDPGAATDHSSATNPDHLVPSTPSLTDIPPLQVAPRYRGTMGSR